MTTVFALQAYLFLFKADKIQVKGARMKPYGTI